jgi:integrase
MFEDICESAGTRSLPSTSLRAWAASWLAGKRVSVTPAVHRHYHSIIERFLALLGAKADRSLDGITPSDIVAYRDQRIAVVASGTLALEIKAIRSLLSSAQRQGLLSHNPAASLEMPRARSLEREVFSVQEIRVLLEAASPEWKTLILCGFYLGGRLRDMATLEWDAVDFGAGTITYRQGKTGNTVVVPIHGELENLLLALAGDQRGGPLCPTLAKCRTDGASGLSNKFGRLMTRAGIDRRVVMSGKNRFSKRSFHSLRHSFTSALASVGVAAELRMKLTGHRSSEVHQTYSHHEISVLKSAIGALPRISEIN